MADERRVSQFIPQLEIEPIQLVRMSQFIPQLEIEPIQLVRMSQFIVMCEVTPNTTLTRAAMPVQMI